MSLPQNQRTRKPSSAYEGKEEDDIVVTSVGPNDVLMGRGAPITENAGNARLRQMVAQRYRKYATAQSHKEKHDVAVRIVHDVMASGGRFLRKIESATTQRTANSVRNGCNIRSSSSSISSNNNNSRSVFRSGAHALPQAESQKKPYRWTVVKDRKMLLVKVKQLLRDMGPEAQEKRLERQRYRYRKLGAKTPLGVDSGPPKNATSKTNLPVQYSDQISTQDQSEPETASITTQPTHLMHHSVAPLDLPNNPYLQENSSGIHVGRHAAYPTNGSNFPSLQQQIWGFPDTLRDDTMVTNASIRSQWSCLDPMFPASSLRPNIEPSRWSLGTSQDEYISSPEAHRILQRQQLRLSLPSTVSPATALTVDGHRMLQDPYSRLLQQTGFSVNDSLRQHVLTHSMTMPTVSPRDTLWLQRMGDTNQPPFFRVSSADTTDIRADLLTGYANKSSTNYAAAGFSSNLPQPSLVRDSYSANSDHLQSTMAQPNQSLVKQQNRTTDNTSPQSRTRAGSGQTSNQGSIDRNQKANK